MARIFNTFGPRMHFNDGMCVCVCVCVVRALCVRVRVCCVCVCVCVSTCVYCVFVNAIKVSTDVSNHCLVLN